MKVVARKRAPDDEFWSALHCWFICRKLVSLRVWEKKMWWPQRCLPTSAWSAKESYCYWKHKWQHLNLMSPKDSTFDQRKLQTCKICWYLSRKVWTSPQPGNLRKFPVDLLDLQSLMHKSLSLRILRCALDPFLLIDGYVYFFKI